MITADQLVCAIVGDYVLQSDWMAQRKTQSLIVALVHAAVYSLPFLFLTQNPVALAFIIVTHAVIDRWRLARYVCWAKNFLAPAATSTDEIDLENRDICIRNPLMVGIVPLYKRKPWWHRWEDCKATGYHKDSPLWLSVWLMIIADNAMHIILNGLALRWWP